MWRVRFKVDVRTTIPQPADTGHAGADAPSRRDHDLGTAEDRPDLEMRSPRIEDCSAKVDDPAAIPAIDGPAAEVRRRAAKRQWLEDGDEPDLVRVGGVHRLDPSLGRVGREHSRDRSE